MSETTQVTLEGKKKECEHLVVHKQRLILDGAIISDYGGKVSCSVCGGSFDLKVHPELGERVGLPKELDKKVKCLKWFSDHNIVFTSGTHYIEELVFDFSKKPAEIVKQLEDFIERNYIVNLGKRTFPSDKKGTRMIREAIKKELQENPSVTPRQFLDKYSKTHWNLSYARVAYNFRKVKSICRNGKH